MNSNISQPLPVLSTGEIREILVRRIDQQKQAAGIVVGVIEPDGRRVIAYGSLAHGDSRTVDGDTIFEIGSITKVFTSLLLADMVEHNEVALDDPADKYLSGVNMPERSGKRITLLDLSTHRSGLPSLPADPKVKEHEFLSSYTLTRDPGSEFEYSNLGAGLLGHLLASRAGTDYEGLIRSRITGPLGMADTGITFSSSMEQRMATGHNGILTPVGRLDLPAMLSGAGALRSSANDMLTFLEAFLGYRESPLASAMKAMLAVRHPTGHGEIGLGWLINSAGDCEIVWHNGATPGFCSFAGYDAKERIGVVVLSNAYTPGGVDDIGFHLLNAWLPLANPEPPREHAEIRIEAYIDPRLLENYTGRYQVTPNLTFEITREGDRFFAQGFAQVNGQAVALPKFELFAEGEKNFFARVADHQIAFETGPDGRATCLILTRAGQIHLCLPL